MDLSKITINHKDNTFGSEEKTYEVSEENSDTRLVWINDKDSVGTKNTEQLKIELYVEPEA